MNTGTFYHEIRMTIMMSVAVFFVNACSIPDQSLFQKGSGSLYEGGVSASELDTEDSEASLEDTASQDTGIDTGLLEDTADEDTGVEDSTEEDTGDDSGLEDTAAEETHTDSGESE